MRLPRWFAVRRAYTPLFVGDVAVGVAPRAPRACGCLLFAVMLQCVCVFPCATRALRWCVVQVSTIVVVVLLACLALSPVTEAAKRRRAAVVEEGFPVGACVRMCACVVRAVPACVPTSSLLRRLLLWMSQTSVCRAA